MRSPPSSSALSAESSWQQRYSQKNRSVAECLTVCVVVRRECNCCKLCTSGVWEDEKGEKDTNKVVYDRSTLKYSTRHHCCCCCLSSNVYFVADGAHANLFLSLNGRRFEKGRVKKERHVEMPRYRGEDEHTHTTPHHTSE